MQPPVFQGFPIFPFWLVRYATQPHFPRHLARDCFQFEDISPANDQGRPLSEKRQPVSATCTAIPQSARSHVTVHLSLSPRSPSSNQPRNPAKWSLPFHHGTSRGRVWAPRMGGLTATCHQTHGRFLSCQRIRPSSRWGHGLIRSYRTRRCVCLAMSPGVVGSVFQCSGSIT